MQDGPRTNVATRKLSGVPSRSTTQPPPLSADCSPKSRGRSWSTAARSLNCFSSESLLWTRSRRSRNSWMNLVSRGRNTWRTSNGMASGTTRTRRRKLQAIKFLVCRSLFSVGNSSGAMTGFGCSSDGLSRPGFRYLGQSSPPNSLRPTSVRLNQWRKSEKEHEPGSENALRVLRAGYYAICRRSYLHASLGRSWRRRHQDRTGTDGRSFKVSGPETTIAGVQEHVPKHVLFSAESFQEESRARFQTSEGPRTVAEARSQV